MSDFRWTTSDEIEIFGRLWPAEQPRALIFLTHGWGDHSGRYAAWVEFLNDQGYSVLGHDLRGHGLSTGQRGFAPGFAALRDDVRLALTKAKQIAPNLPYFFYAHSFGGLLILNYLLSHQQEIRQDQRCRGAIITGPLLRLMMPVPIWKILLGRTIGKLLPRFTLKAGIDTSKLSHDPQAEQDLKRDPYRHGLISARIFFDMVDAGKETIANAHNLPCPVLLVHGGSDKITSCAASQELAENCPHQVDFRMWIGMYHEIHNETNKDQVFRDINGWLVDLLDSPQGD